MKNLINTALCVLLVIACISSCIKKKNYSNIDHTAGMGGTRSWSGNTNGYYKGDTVLSPPDTTHSAWAKVFSHIVTDSIFSVQKLDGYRVSVLGTSLPYRSTDSLTKIVRYNTTFANSAVTVLNFYYDKDSMTFEYHKLDEFNVAANNYYQLHMFLHTN